jgi:HAD superfamily hydrolase (TIGR01549 family)
MDSLDEPEPAQLIIFSERTYQALKKLCEKHELVIYTNSPEYSTKRILETLKIRPFFSGVYHAGDFPQSKPYQPALDSILAKHKQRPIIAVGDSIEKDLLPLKVHGAKAVWVNLFEEVHPQVDAVIRDIGDLLSLKFL